MRYIDTCNTFVWKQGTNKKIIYLGVYRVTVCSDILWNTFLRLKRFMAGHMVQ